MDQLVDFSWVNKPGVTGFDIALGRYPNISSYYQFAASSLITTTEAILGSSTPYEGFVDTAVLLDIVSTSAEDTMNTGTHAWKLLIRGLDTDWNPIEEEVELSGITPVTTTKLFQRVNSVEVTTGGNNEHVGGANLGVITVYATGVTASQFSIIQVAHGKDELGRYSVPAKKKCLIANADANLGEGKDADIFFKCRDTTVDNSVFVLIAHRNLYQNSFLRNYEFPRLVGEKTDIVMTAISSASGTLGTGSFELALIDA